MNLTVKRIVYIGLLTALTIVATFINIVLPVGGGSGALFHLGTAVSVMSVLVFGKRVGTYSGTLGMTLFDIIGGWAIWAPGTFVARFLLGSTLGFFAYDKNGKLKGFSYQVLGVVMGGVLMVLVYYIWEVILYHQPIVALGSVPANVLQFATGIVIGIPAATILNKSLRIEKY